MRLVVLEGRAESGIRRACWIGLAIAVLLMTVAAVLQARRSSADPASLASAHWMLETLAGRPPSGGPIKVDRPPGYALFLTGAALVLPGLPKAYACWAANPDACSVGSITSIVAGQLALAIGGLLLVFRLARNLSGGNLPIALIATALAYLASRLGQQAGLVRGMGLYAVLSLAGLVLLTEWYGRRSLWIAAAAGATSGLAALIEPLALAMVAAGAIVMSMQAPRDGSSPLQANASAIAMAAGAASAMTALLAIASSLSLAPSSVLGASAVQFAERLAFVGIPASTSLAQIVTSVPYLGDALAAMLPETEARLIAAGGPLGSLVAKGGLELLPDARLRSGSDTVGAIRLLAAERILAMPGAYLASIPVVLARGLFAGGGLIALIGVFHVPAMLRFARADDRLGLHLLVLVPIVALLLANTLFTANAFWLNPLLPVLYAYAIATVASGW